MATAVALDSAKNVFSIDDALSSFDIMADANAVFKEAKRKRSSKRPPILTPEILEEQNAKAIHNDPNVSGKRKLLHLERHQRLHLLYESGKLRKCLLSCFLKVVEQDRLKLLSWMGSKLAVDIKKPTCGDLPTIPLRLAKIPQDYGLGGDKGFSGVEGYLPNLNEVVTPPQVANSNTH